MVGLRQLLLQVELREAVETRLSAMLGEPVSIGRLGVAIFPRLSVTGGDVRVGEAGTQAPALAIERIRLLPRLRPLLSGDVVIDEVQLDGFVVAVLHDEKGWHVPSVMPAPVAGDRTGAVIERVRLAGARVRIYDRVNNREIVERSSIDALHAEVFVDAGGVRLSPITGRIGGAAISGEARVDAKDARIELSAEVIADEDLPVFLRLLGSERPAFLQLLEPAALSADLRVDRATSRLHGTGSLRAPAVMLDPLRLLRFEAPWVIKGPRLEFAPATFTLYDGRHTGRVGVDLGATPPTWSTDSRVSGIDAGTFLTALTGRDQRFDGTGSITGVLRGRVGEPLASAVGGRARVEVTNGVIRQFPLLASVNRALRLAEQEGSDTRFERLSATLSIASGASTTDDLVLEAAHLRVEAAGRIGADRSLALRGVAVVSPQRSSAAIASIRELSGLRNPSGEIEIPLTISGSLDAPSFGLDLQSAIKKGLADELRRRLRRIIRE
jgi:AsmA protein